MSDISSMIDELEKTGKLIYSNHGTSMMPLIKQGRDLVVIEKKNGRLSKYDVPLYKVGTSHRYVLHRIIKVRENDYVIRGDNCLNKEFGITDDDILGVLTKVIRNGKEISVEARGYKLYSRIWHIIFPFRFLYMKARRLGGKILRKLGLRK